MSSIAEVAADVNIGAQHARNGVEYGGQAKAAAAELPVPALISGLGDLVTLVADIQREDALPAVQQLYHRAAEEMADGDTKYKEAVGSDPLNDNAATMVNGINFAGLKARNSERGSAEISERLGRVAGYLHTAMQELKAVEYTYYPELVRDGDAVIDFGESSIEAAGQYVAGLTQSNG